MSQLLKAVEAFQKVVVHVHDNSTRFQIGLTVLELAELVGVSKRQAYNYISALDARGLIRPNGTRNKETTQGVRYSTLWVWNTTVGEPKPAFPFRNPFTGKFFK